MSTDEGKQQLTTGEAIAALYGELIAGGVPEDVAGDIVRGASAGDLRDGIFSVRKGQAVV